MGFQKELHRWWLALYCTSSRETETRGKRAWSCEDKWYFNSWTQGQKGNISSPFAIVSAPGNFKWGGRYVFLREYSTPNLSFILHQAPSNWIIINSRYRCSNSRGNCCWYSEIRNTSRRLSLFCIISSIRLADRSSRSTYGLRLLCVDPFYED